MYTYWRNHYIDLYDVPKGFQERLQRYELCNDVLGADGAECHDGFAVLGPGADGDVEKAKGWL